MPEVPPEVIGEELRTAIFLPAALDFKRLGIHDKNSARAIAIRGSDCIDVNAVRSAMGSMWPAVAGALQHSFGLDDLYQTRITRIGLDVDDVNAR